jgi:hypothetical protein
MHSSVVLSDEGEWGYDSPDECDLALFQTKPEKSTLAIFGLCDFRAVATHQSSFLNRIFFYRFLNSRSKTGHVYIFCAHRTFSCLTSLSYIFKSSPSSVCQTPFPSINSLLRLPAPLSTHLLLLHVSNSSIREPNSSFTFRSSLTSPVLLPRANSSLYLYLLPNLHLSISLQRHFCQKDI